MNVCRNCGAIKKVKLAGCQVCGYMTQEERNEVVRKELAAMRGERAPEQITMELSGCEGDTCRGL